MVPGGLLHGMNPARLGTFESSVPCRSLELAAWAGDEAGSAGWPGG